MSTVVSPFHFPDRVSAEPDRWSEYSDDTFSPADAPALAHPNPASSHTTTASESQTQELQAPPPSRPLSDAPSGPHDAPAGAPSTHRPEDSQTQKSTALVDAAVNFVATASNGTLGACLIGLGASTYIILGSVGLVLIGVVGGVVLHASWDGSLQQLRLSPEDNNPLAVSKNPLDVISRAVQLRQARKSISEPKTGDEGGTKLARNARLDLTSFRPATAAALAEFTDVLVATHVSSWYSYLVPGDFLFPEACHQTVVQAVLSVGECLSRKRPADVLLDFMTNASSIVIVFLNELLAAVNASPGVPVPKAVDAYLKANPDSNLARLVDRASQQNKLDAVADDILRCFLDKQTVDCTVAHTFLKQVLSRVVLDAMIQKCADEDFINQWIIYLLTESDGPESGDSDGVDGPDTLLSEQVHASHHKSTHSDDQIQVVSKAHEAIDKALHEAQRMTDEMNAEREVRGSDGSGKTSSPYGPAPPASATSLATNSSRPSIDRISTKSFGSPSEASDLSRGSGEADRGRYSTFDQILPKSSIIDGSQSKPPPLLLHKATIILFDETPSNAPSVIKSQPKWDFTLQIEPENHHYSGWIVVRKYVDFVNLHEVLRRISVISGVSQFSIAHPTLPTWKGQSPEGLRKDLEAYLNDAIRMAPLADCEGMRRFLEKEMALQSGNHSPLVGSGGLGPRFGGLSWPNPSAFETMGKGMIDALSKAPKEIAGGGKSLIGNVTGVFGGAKRSSSTLENVDPASAATPRMSLNSEPGRQSVEYSASYEPVPTAAVAGTALSQVTNLNSRSGTFGSDLTGPSTCSGHSTPKVSLDRVRNSESGPSPVDELVKMNLPLPPSMMPDHFTGTASASNFPAVSAEGKTVVADDGDPARLDSATETTRARTSASPITEDETRLSIDLVFALLSSLYTLSPSFWTVRRSLLSAAKSFLLRPGTDQLDSIRELLQSAVIDAYTSDDGIAGLVYNLRRTCFPLPRDGLDSKAAATSTTKSTKSTTNFSDERDFASTESDCHSSTVDGSGIRSSSPSSSSSSSSSSAERSRTRAQARHLAEQKAVPAAVASVMGAAATREAVGRVWESLMIKEVSRGVLFGILLQGLRTLTQ